MNIIFFGSSRFAEYSLLKLISSGMHNIPAVVTRPDREKGRNLKITATPVKETALRNRIPVYQPEDLSDPQFKERLIDLSPDVFVVVSYGNILTADILDIPLKKVSLNVHPSLLPAYRGAAPINWAILKGETKTGVTVIKMNEKMDAGDMASQARIPIEPEDDAVSLHDKLGAIGAELLLKTLSNILSGTAVYLKQDDARATLAPRLKKEDGIIDWNKGAVDIRNMIRGLVPWPGAYTYISGKKIIIRKADAVDGAAKAGEITGLTRESLIVGSGNGLVSIKELQLEGKKQMDIACFLRGFRGLKKGEILESR